MVSTETYSVSVQADVCGYCVDRVLTAGQSYLAVGPGGRGIVLKAIDSDCIVRGVLHPTIRDRLSRVRELAHGSVANLLGVERDGDTAYLVWEYIDGVTFDFYAGANHTPREMAAAARELVLAVDLLHMQGIIHGALIGSNVIIASGANVRLTHISPLLFTDPAVDITCLWNLLEHAAEILGSRGTTLGMLVVEAREKKWTLRQMATRLGALIDPRESRKPAEIEVKLSSSLRKRSLFGAAFAAVLGVAVAWGVWHAAGSGQLGLHQGLHLPFQNAALR